MTESQINAKQAIARFRLTLQASCIGLAVIHMIFFRRMLDPDGVSYLGIAKAYLRHDWPMAFNSYWSPLYSWLLALGLAVHPGFRWQLYLPHIFSLVSFIVMIGAWEWLLKEFRRWAGPPEHPFIVTLASYVTLLWVGLKLNGMLFTSADIIVTALMVMCGALLMRVRSEGALIRDYILIGATLGTAFLAKAALILLIPIVLLEIAVMRAVAFRETYSTLGVGLVMRVMRDSRVYIVVAVALIIMLPFIIGISAKENRFTIGRSGALNYSWEVTGMSVEGYKDSKFRPG